MRSVRNWGARVLWKNTAARGFKYVQVLQLYKNNIEFDI